MNETVAELLSAYLDGALEAREREQFETRLAEDAELRRQLDGMRQVVSGLRALPRIAPSPVAELALVRRLELVDAERGLAARLLRRFPRIAEQPVIAVTFALVLAIATIVGFLARSVDPAISGRIPVVLDPAPPAAPEVALAVRHTGHGTFHRVDDTWIAADVVGPPDVIVGPSEVTVIELLDDADFAKLVASAPVRLRLRGQVVEIRSPTIGAAGSSGEAQD